ncbi:MAG: GNAT family N-acetyltransferase [Acidimicrobiales bacterium]
MSVPSAMGSPEMLRGLQERAARATPAKVVEIVEGWWLRHAPDTAWWIGSVLPHGGEGVSDLLRRVVRAERFYAAHGSTARFQICPPACAEQLDTVLEERRYRRMGLVSIQVALTEDVRQHSPDGSLRVRLEDHPTRSWLESWHEVRGHGGDPDAEWDMLGRLALPSAYALAMLGDDVVAVGRSVEDTGWAGVFGMATLSLARGQGAGRSVLHALADWAGEHQVDRMYLQVEHDNVPAIRLYGSASFTEICSYHYRSA